MTTHEVLVKARNRIERTGWTQALTGPRHGPNCIYAACSWEAGTSVGTAKAANELRNALELKHPRLSLMVWNDQSSRTKEEVLAAFDKAIAATAPEPADPLSGQEDDLVKREVEELCLS
jgi:hypothetical protein